MMRLKLIHVSEREPKWHFMELQMVAHIIHADVIKLKHKGQWSGALMFSLINGWVNNRKAGDLRRYRAHYDVIVMKTRSSS